MSLTEVDDKRRQFLKKTTLSVGAIGAVMATYPFIASMSPNAKAMAQGAPVRVKLMNMRPGDQLTVVWRGRPVWIIRRSEEMLQALGNISDLLRDPKSKTDQQPAYARNLYRSIKPKFLVLVGVCTHLGCAPTYRPTPNSVQAEWPGGFFCSCHGSKFDLAGRVFKHVPAPLNLEVPPYVFLSDDEILIGSHKLPKTVLQESEIVS